MCRFGANASVSRLAVGVGDSGDCSIFNLLAGGVSVDGVSAGSTLIGDGVLTARDFNTAADGERSIGGGKTGCLAIAAVRRLAELIALVTRFVENGEGTEGARDFRFSGDGDGVRDW